MSVPTSVEELLQLIRKSGMVDDPKLSAYLQRRPIGRSLPTDARDATETMIEDGILTHFQAEQFLLGKWRGFTIGKYKLLERIGIGGMGQVFLAEHMFMKRRVALKVLPPAKAEQPAALGRFYREARAAGSLEHPHIVRTHDIDQDGNLHFIVMEYVDGSNLLEIVKKFGPLSPGRAASYAHQIALGLDFAYRNGIIHRDVKPGNVLVDRRGRAKVLDLGLARFYKDQNDLLTVKYDDKIVLGTADYVAPEQVANSHAVDVRVDVYGLGATLYFLLAGHPPFPVGTVSQKLVWHRSKEPTPIRQVRPEVPEGLADVVATMMAKDPRHRFQTPADAAVALRIWIPDHIPQPVPEEMPQLCLAVNDLLADGDVRQVDSLELKNEPTVEPVAASVGSTAAKTPTARPKPVLSPGPFAPSPTPASRAGLLFPPSPSTSVANPPRPAGTFGSPFGSGPRPPLPENVTPLAAPRPPAADPVMAPIVPPVNNTADPQAFRLAVAALVGAFLVLGGGLIYWKFGKPVDPPAGSAPAQR